MAKNGEGIWTDGILGSLSCRRKVNGLGASANRKLRVGVLGLDCIGVFLFSTLDRLKIGVREYCNKLLIGVAGVLITSGPEPPGIRLSAIVSAVDDCLLYTSPSPRDRQKSRMPSSA